mmetsp:Transcript_28189/g.56908  ORF Transcript_28189/g.56908 Transcript_28189/m.56908 type:complete len:293 (+) Transcript_28189:1253-2131(+)
MFMIRTPGMDGSLFRKEEVFIAAVRVTDLCPVNRPWRRIEAKPKTKGAALLRILIIIPWRRYPPLRSTSCRSSRSIHSNRRYRGEKIPVPNNGTVMPENRRVWPLPTCNTSIIIYRRLRERMLRRRERIPPSTTEAEASPIHPSTEEVNEKEPTPPYTGPEEAPPPIHPSRPPVPPARAREIAATATARLVEATAPLAAAVVANPAAKAEEMPPPREATRDRRAPVAMRNTRRMDEARAMASREVRALANREVAVNRGVRREGGIGVLLETGMLAVAVFIRLINMDYLAMEG